MGGRTGRRNGSASSRSSSGCPEARRRGFILAHTGETGSGEKRRGLGVARAAPGESADTLREDDQVPLQHRERRLVAGANARDPGRGRRAHQGQRARGDDRNLAPRWLPSHLGVDLVLVLQDMQTYSAAQRIRASYEPRRGGSAELGLELVESAESLAARAREGRLVAFVGAGVSMTAGLPGVGRAAGSTRRDRRTQLGGTPNNSLTWTRATPAVCWNGGCASGARNSTSGSGNVSPPATCPRSLTT